MCGIYGMATFDGAPLRYTDKSEAMGALQRHRGPDSSRVVQTGEALLGCERLRIIDLRERADQPFACSEVGCVVACNGEIYNHSELRSEVSDYRWVSDSDVEVILPLFLRHGAQAIERLEGMFALAIWDARDRTLILARDPAGEKPLFYIEIGGEIWFASEIQSLLVHPQLERRLDEKAFAQYAMLGYVPGDRTAFAGIRKVPPGTICTFSAGGRTTCRYWRPERLPATVGSTPELIEELQRRIQSAVVRQLRADVPVGIFLSGGVDSAVITALAARDMAPGSLRTFSVGFSEPSFDEGSDAARLARRLGTKHHDVVADETALADALTVFV